MKADGGPQLELIGKDDEFEKKFSSIEKGRRQFHDFTLDQVMNNDNDIFKRLLRKLISSQETGESDEPEDKQSIEAFISKLGSLREAFDCFIALSQPQGQGGLMTQLNQRELTDEQRELLGYLMKIEHRELAEMFDQKLTNISSLNEFVRDLAHSGSQQLKNLFRQSSCSKLKQQVFRALIAPTLADAAECQNSRRKPKSSI